MRKRPINVSIRIEASNGVVDAIVTKLQGEAREAHCMGSNFRQAMESAGIYIDSELKRL
jgi:hypothetical protein